MLDDEPEPDAPPKPGLPVYSLWPEHERAFVVFLSLATRWRVGFDRVLGLDYSEMRIEVARACRKGKRPGSVAECEQLEHEIRELEAGALQGWKQRREEEQLRQELERQRTRR